MIAYRRFYRRVHGKAEAAESIIAYQVKPYATTTAQADAIAHSM